MEIADLHRIRCESVQGRWRHGDNMIRAGCLEQGSLRHDPPFSNEQGAKFFDGTEAVHSPCFIDRQLNLITCRTPDRQQRKTLDMGGKRTPITGCLRRGRHLRGLLRHRG